MENKHHPAVACYGSSGGSVVYICSCRRHWSTATAVVVSTSARRPTRQQAAMPSKVFLAAHGGASTLGGEGCRTRGGSKKVGRKVVAV